ncbi:hypothetical protein PybrP1_002942 [[Pythium] brassicae (nom. inval.)]|nr:hypothetical protein PybrP1_002942 [[Pythium] brassicae (nom. inval.)]
MEFLVHNISHSDLIVELSWVRDDPSASAGEHVPLSLLGRPKFSLFQQTGHAILEALAAADARGARLSSACEDGGPAPVGFQLSASPIAVSSLHDFQIRGGSETFELIARHWKRVAITAVYFPLVALLLPKWRHVLREFKSERSRQLLYLISGAGIPRNEAHAVHGNSTESTARLLALFVQLNYPQMDVIQVHSGSNIFRFDDNVQFMTRELRPRLEAHREALVDRFGDAWKAHFHVTIAYTDGPPARLSALNASLRMYRPSYLHLWQLKTFWHERRLSMGDVDFHSFENIEASPCVAASDADALTQALVHEMRVFRDQFLRAEGDGEVGAFWLRKSRKPVLAVLLVEKQDACGATRLVVHRGMNCEVSMPTGSLCAERNAIGSALASDPTLKRRAMKMIGVLSLNLGATPAAAAVATATSVATTTTTTSKTTAAETAASREPLASPHAMFAGIPRVGALELSTTTETTVVTAATTAAAVAGVNSDDSVDGEDGGSDGATTAVASAVASGLAHAATTAATQTAQEAAAAAAAPSSPKRRRLHTQNANYQSPRKPKRPRTFSVDDTAVETALALADNGRDRNPLAPCGACKEWLVKIAEANPAFRVVTFENSRCRSVYVSQIM